MTFTGPLITEQIGHELWKVAKGFAFIDSKGVRTDIPAGFETDLASIPSVAQGIVSKVGYWSQAAVVHDLLYYRHRNGMDTTTTRLQADDTLLEGCKLKADEYSVSDMERRNWLIYGAVRVGGLSSWETPEERRERLNRLSLPDEVIE